MSRSYALTLQGLVLLIAATCGLASDATLKEADAAFNSGNYQGAVDIYAALAETGNAEAMARLGKFYQWGVWEGAEGAQFIDLEKAFYWRRAGAEAGDPESQYYLAEMYQDGFGDVVLPSSDEARNWYLRAFEGYLLKAKKGDREAMYQIGLMYEHGQGVDGDLGSAHKWMRRAAEQRSVQATTWIVWAYLTAKGVEKSGVEAKRWMARSMEISPVGAPILIAAQARGAAPLSCSVLADAYELRASVGDEEAIRELGYVYTYNRGSYPELGSCLERNYESARRILRIGVRVCNSYSMNMLGDHYYHGFGIPVNYQEARKWYLLAADLFDSSAMNNLGIMSSSGEGVPQDYLTAHMWFNLSNSEEGKSAFGSSGAARANITALEESMSSAQIARAQQMAADWKPRKSCTPASAMELIGEKPIKPPASGPAHAPKNKKSFKDAVAD